MDDHLTEQVLSSEPLYLGKLVHLYLEEVKLPNGEPGRREIIKHPGAVAMVPLHKNGDVLLVRQFRLAANQVMLEIPAGTLNPGEDPLLAAGRELQEEVRVRAGKLERIGGQFAAPGYTTEYIHLYLATDLTVAPLELDEDEFLEIVRMPFDEAIRRVLAGEINDSKTISALLLAARRLGR